MKHHALFPSALLLIALAMPAAAAFETWTNKTGLKAELELVSVTGSAGEKTGTFRMRNGKTVQIKAADLSPADAERLDAATPAATPAPASDKSAETPAAEGGKSVFDSYLDGGLSKLNGKKVERLKDWSRPAKYYVFYFSASWCGPCHKFTPNLIEFYNNNKNADFEIFLTSHDSDDKDLEKYVKELNQPWPFLKVSKTAKFEKAFKFDVTSIPTIIICDPQGTVIDGGNAGLMMGTLDKLIVRKEAPTPKAPADEPSKEGKKK